MTNYIISAASPTTPMKHLLFLIRHVDYCSAALHVRCIARKFRSGQSLEWHIAGLRRALCAWPNRTAQPARGRARRIANPRDSEVGVRAVSC